MVKEYIKALKQGLTKKTELLDEILDKCREQKQLLLDDNLRADDFDASVEAKAGLIDELNRLDAGFEQVYARVRDEIMTDTESYRDEIREMQHMISVIISKSTLVQNAEAENKELAQNKFAKVKKQIKEVKASQKAVNQYYQNMMKLNYVDPQFLDNKK